MLKCLLMALSLILGDTAIIGRRKSSDDDLMTLEHDFSPHQVFDNREAANLFKVRTILEQYKSEVRKRLASSTLKEEFSSITDVGNQTRRMPFKFGIFVSQQDEIPEEFVKSPEIPKINHNLREYLYQGDVRLTLEQAKQMLLQKDDESLRKRRQAQNLNIYPEAKYVFRMSKNVKMWDRGEVSFTFSPTISTKTKELIIKAMDFWASNTCISFHERGLKDPGHKIRFYRGTGCFSYVGKITEKSPQPISIGDECNYVGVIAHEIAHALGFFHAQSRHDRDKYVKFQKNNLAKGCEDDFYKETIDSNDNYQTPYDYGSVMHYSDVACSKSNSPVLVANEKYNQHTMGQRMQPSFLDVFVMNKHYGCTEKCSLDSEITANCVNDGYPHPRNCSQCICPWGFGGDLCDSRQIAPDDPTCGSTLKADEEWRDLRGEIGEASKVVRSDYASCHWHVVAPEGFRVRLQVVKIGLVCSIGCFYGNVEFKISDDFARTGIRMCCSDDLEPNGVLELVSKTRLAVINLYSNFFIQKFHIRYKIAKNN